MPSRPPSSRWIVPSTFNAVSSAARHRLVDRHLATDLAERAAPALAVRRPVAGDVGDVLPAHQAPVGQTHARRDHLRRRDLETTLREPLGYAQGEMPSALWGTRDAGGSSSVARMATTALETSAFAFASDLAGRGRRAVLDNIQHRGGLGGITPAFSYHAARDTFPHNPVRKVRCSTRRARIFPPDLNLD